MMRPFAAIKGGFAMGEQGNPEQARIGTALEVAGNLLKRGELDGARRVLWEIKEPLQILVSYQPQTAKPESGSREPA